MDDVSMKYKIGEKVRVKSYEEIQKTLDGSCHVRGDYIYFNIEMKEYCGKIYEIESYASAGPYYHLRHCERKPGDYWQWPKEWLEPVLKFKEGSLVVVRPDLVPGKMYGNEVFIDDMIPTKGTVVKIKNVDSFMNLYNIKENHWNYSNEMFLPLEEAFRPGRRVCKKNGNIFSNGESVLMVGDLVEDKAWLPEIQIYVPVQDLEILPDRTQAQIDSAVALSNIPRTLKIADIDYEIKKVDYEKYLDLFNPIKIQNNENQLQGKKTSIRRTEVPEGHRIRSRKCKASVVIGHLSNQARTGF